MRGLYIVGPSNNIIPDAWVVTRATPKILAPPVTKNISPVYSREIHGWDFSWPELLEWLEEGGVALQPTTPAALAALAN